jgi:hypothetical protein
MARSGPQKKRRVDSRPTPSASPRHNLDTQCGFADIAKMSDSCNSSPSRDSAAQKQRGERVMTSILDFHDYPEIETDGVRAVVVAL